MTIAKHFDETPEGFTFVKAPNIEDALLNIRELPTLPAVLGKILSTAADPDASAIDLGRLIAADQSLSATLLKLVNSSYYGFYRQIKTVTQAIVVLGFLEVRNLTLTATAFQAFDSVPSKYDRPQLWRHSLAVAIAADRIAKLLKRNTEGCFESGLLHDLGKVVLDWLYPELYRDAVANANTNACSIADAELPIFTMNHATVGGLLGEYWNLPESVVETIRFHHDPASAKLDPEQVHIIAAANALTYRAGLGEASSGCPPELSPEIMARLGLTEAHCNTVVAELAENAVKIEQMVGTLTGSAA
jgi:putative nucleotidyltransferase with HDIG domain